MMKNRTGISKTAASIGVCTVVGAAAGFGLVNATSATAEKDTASQLAEVQAVDDQMVQAAQDELGERARIQASGAPVDLEIYTNAVLASQDCVVSSATEQIDVAGLDAEVTPSELSVSADKFLVTAGVQVINNSAEVADIIGETSEQCFTKHVDAVETLYQLDYLAQPTAKQDQLAVAGDCLSIAPDDVQHTINQELSSSDVPSDKFFDCIEDSPSLVALPHLNADGTLRFEE